MAKSKAISAAELAVVITDGEWNADELAQLRKAIGPDPNATLTEDALKELLAEVVVPEVSDVPVQNLDLKAIDKELAELPQNPHEPVETLNSLWLDLKKSADDDAKKMKKLIATAQHARDQSIDSTGKVKARITALNERRAALVAEADKARAEKAKLEKAKSGKGGKK